MAATREIGLALQKFREVLLGRKHMNPLRFPQVRNMIHMATTHHCISCQVVATRDWDQVTPNLPPGPSHKLVLHS